MFNNSSRHPMFNDPNLSEADNQLNILAVAIWGVAEMGGEGVDTYRQLLGSAFDDILPYGKAEREGLNKRPLAALPYDAAMRSALAKTQAADAVWAAYYPEPAA